MELNSTQEPFLPSSENGCAASNETITDPKPGTSLQSCNRHECDQSLNAGISNHNMADEISSSSGTRLYFCDLCNMSFASVSCLEMLAHNCEKPSQQITDKVLHESVNLENRTGILAEKERFQCNECRKTYSSKKVLNQHMIIHTGEKPYKCEVCDSTFYRKGYLTRHMRVHTGEKPYKCEVCDRTFYRKGHLTVHMRTHTGERPYQCHVCKIHFRRQTHLTNHMRRHTGEKPYMCVICKKCFRINNDMKKHLRRHLGKKSYKCKMCEKAFFDHSYFMTHLHKHTGKQL